MAGDVLDRLEREVGTGIEGTVLPLPGFDVLQRAAAEVRGRQMREVV